MKQGKPADAKFAGEESRYENSSTTPSTAGTKSVIGVDDSSTECDMYCWVMPYDTVDDTCHQNDDDSEVEWAVISQLSTREAQNLEACCELEDDLRAEFSSFNKVILQDLTNHSPQIHENAQTKGFSDILKDNIVIMCNSVLGLGFKSLGFDHDFFQALMI